MRGETPEVVLGRLRRELAEAREDWLTARAALLVELATLGVSLGACRHRAARRACRVKLAALRRRAYVGLEYFKRALDKTLAAKAALRN
jgi:hypothetical protein